MPPLVDDTSGIEHQHTVGLFHRTEPVCDDQRGTMLQEGMHRLVQSCLRVGIQ